MTCEGSRISETTCERKASSSGIVGSSPNQSRCATSPLPLLGQHQGRRQRAQLPLVHLQLFLGALALGDVDAHLDQGWLPGKGAGGYRKIEPAALATLPQKLDLEPRRPGLTPQARQPPLPGEISIIGRDHVPEVHGQEFLPRVPGEGFGRGVHVGERRVLDNDDARPSCLRQGAEPLLARPQIFLYALALDQVQKALEPLREHMGEGRQ